LQASCSHSPLIVRLERLERAAMQIGDVVCWRDRRWLVRGFTPAGVPERLVELEEVETGEWARAPVDEPELEGHGGGSVVPLRPRPKRR
jgi:hypothetical protein